MRLCCLLLALLLLSACNAPVDVASARLAAPIPTVVPLPSPTPPPPTPSPLPTETPQPTPTPTPEYLPGEPAPELAGELVIRTYSIDFYWTPGGLDPESIKSIAIPTEQAIITGSARIGGGLAGRVSISFEPPQRGECAIRGLTLSSERTIILYYEPESDPQRVLRILSHELFHQLQHDYYGQEPHLRSDVIMLEGMAVWGSSPYFLDDYGRPIYQVEARAALDSGQLLPLTYSLEADCRTTSRVNIYNQWASFVEYLLEAYGREQLDALYISSSGRTAGSSDYAGVYGKPLVELEAEWISWLAQQQY